VQSPFWRYTAMVAGSIVMITLGSCKGREGSESASRNAEPPAPADTGMQAISTDTTGSASSRLTDPNIVALLDEANAADSAAGAFALRRATSPDVKNFAKMMMGEHHALRLQGQQLAKRLNVTPQPPANDPLPAAAQGEMTALQGAPKGAQFDRTYIEQEIGIHKAVLDLAAKGHDQAQNEDLKKLIEQAKPVIEKHLNRAEQLQKKLGGPTT
jgi:putative membrane protein